MRFVFDLHIEIGPRDEQSEQPEQRDSALDAAIERRDEIDHASAPIGFGRQPEERA